MFKDVYMHDYDFPRVLHKGNMFLKTFEAQSSEELPMTLGQTPERLRDYTRMTFELTHYVYAYGFRGVIIYLALTALLLHTLTVLIHLAIMLRQRNRDGNESWLSPGDIMLLALNSPVPYEVWDVDSGGNKKALWRLRARLTSGRNNGRRLLIDQEQTADSDSEEELTSSQPKHRKKRPWRGLLSRS